MLNRQMQRYLKTRRGVVVGPTSDNPWLYQPPRLCRFGGSASLLLLAQPPLLDQGGDWRLAIFNEQFQKRNVGIRQEKWA